MGLRFFRRMKIAPGVTLNLSKSGVSSSFGVRGAKVTLGSRGIRRTLGLPGTGLFYTELNSAGGSGGGAGGSAGRKAAVAPPATVSDKLDIGFFDRLLIPKEEEAFVDGCKAYIGGDIKKAIRELGNAAHLADGAFLAGCLIVTEKRYTDAEALLKKGLASHTTLGKYFDKYELNIELGLPVTDTVIAHISPCRRGLLLTLVEVLQAQGKNKEALDYLKKLRKENPEDVLVKLSIAELICEAKPESKRLAKQLVELIGSVGNESSIHAGLMFYKASALRTLGLCTAARDVLTAAMRKTKDRPEDLLRAIRYERACVYEELGQAARSRTEFEKVYAEDPGHEEVAARLGL